MADPVLKALKANLTKAQSEIDTIVAKAGAADRGLTTQENAEFSKLIAHRADLCLRIDTHKAENKRRTKALASGAAILGSGMGQTHVVSEQMTYSPSSRHSYLLDLATISIASRSGGVGDGAPEARERMGQHLKELSIESRNKATARILTESRFVRPGQEIRTNPNTTAGTGGEFVPPLWLVSQYVPFARAGRVCANRLVNQPLPPGVDVINIPKITTGSTTAIQAANAAAVSSTDIITSTVAANVNTIAGQEDISLQLLEQSPIAMDGVVFEDLAHDYDQKLDQQVLYGTGSNGQHQGVLTVTSQTSNTSNLKANAVTVSSALFFDGSTAATQYRSIVNGVTTIESLRYASPTAIWVHPRRANSWAFAADSSTANSGRPLYQSTKYGTYNDVGTFAPNPVPQGMAGEVFGLPVIKDANVPTTMNATATTGGTADPIIILKEDDCILWEGQLRLRALPEILSGTLQIRFQVYCYSALQVQRFLPSISILSGNTGLAAPVY